MSFTAVIGAHARGSCVEGARELFLAKHFEQAEVDNHDDYPIIYWVLTIPGGAGFCPSTVLRVKMKIHVLLVVDASDGLLGVPSWKKEK